MDAGPDQRQQLRPPVPRPQRQRVEPNRQRRLRRDPGLLGSRQLDDRHPGVAHRTGRGRRYLQVRLQDGTYAVQRRGRRLRRDVHHHPAEPHEAHDRLRLLVPEREARPDAPLHLGQLPARVRQRLDVQQLRSRTRRRGNEDIDARPRTRTTTASTGRTGRWSGGSPRTSDPRDDHQGRRSSSTAPSAATRTARSVNYNGRAILYSAGDIEFDEVVCAGGNGSNNCCTGNMCELGSGDEHADHRLGGLVGVRPGQ